MPAYERVGPHDRQQLTPRDDARQQREGYASSVVGSLRPNLTLDVTGELFAKEQVLGREVCTRSGGRSQQPQDVSEQGERRSKHVTP